MALFYEIDLLETKLAGLILREGSATQTICAGNRVTIAP